MAAPIFADNTDAEPNVNGIYKEALGWLPASAVRVVTNSGSFDLYPVDDPALTNGRLYLLKLPVLGLTPAGLAQAFALEYRKQALTVRSPARDVWPGVYPFLSQEMSGCDVPFVFVLRTQPVNPDTSNGITPLATNAPTMLDPGGLVVQVTDVNESFARVSVDFNGTIRPVLREFFRSDTHASFELCGVRTGAVVMVERSWSLPTTLWDSVTNFVSDGRSTHWSEMLITNQPAAYYRVRVE